VAISLKNCPVSRSVPYTATRASWY
jgi:hypothetical protein